MPAIPGGNFETGWTTANVLSPLGWSFNSDPSTVTQTNDSYKGNYAIQLKTLSPNSNAGITSGINKKGSSGGRPYNRTKDTLIGYYKYTSIGKDSGSVYLQFTKNGNYIWSTGLTLAPASNYTQFSIPFNLPSTPDSMRIDIENNHSNMGIAHVGSTLIVDEVQLKSAPLHTGIDENIWVDNKVKVYPNPASNSINFEFHNAMLSNNITTLKVFNNLGEIVYLRDFAGDAVMINLVIAGYNKGIYHYSFTNAQNLIQGSFMKN
jgi:hypothetical protein